MVDPEVGTLTLVTGATGGIGLATAKAVSGHAAPGDLVVITGRDADKFAAAEAAIRAAGHAEALALRCDHAVAADVEAVAARVLALSPAALRVVANVGWNPVHQHGPKKTQNVDLAVLRAALAVNVETTVLLLARLLVAMRERKGGSIVLVGSQAYRYGIPGQLAYNVSKAALVGLKNTLAAEYGRSGVACHLVNPGVVMNERTARLRRRPDAAVAAKTVTEEEVAAAIVELLAITEPAANGQERDV